VHRDDSFLHTEILTECPQCGSRDFRLWRLGKDLLLGASGLHFPYMRCANCDLIFLSERPTTESIGMFYPENYHPYSKPVQFDTSLKERSAPERLFEGVEIRLVENLRKRLMKFLERKYPDDVIPAMQRFSRTPRRGALLLDFGCGSSWMLNRFRELKWATIGMDFNETIVEQVRKDGHRGILVCNEGWAEIDDGSVDAVRMNHVLEHLYDPRPTLSNLLAKMTAGGRIHIAVPNPRGLSALLFRSKWFSLEAPRHVMLYSPKGLGKLLSDTGFVDVKVFHERTSKDLARSLGYCLRDLHILKAELVLGMADEPLLNAWLTLLTWPAGGMGFGDRIHAFASKAAGPQS